MPEQHHYTDVGPDGGFDEIEITFDPVDQSLHIAQEDDVIGLSKKQLRDILATLRRMETYFR